MRTDESAARKVAKRLVSNASIVSLWCNFGDELRDMIVDSAVMDAVRLSDDSSKLETCQLVAFRERVVEALTDGVMIGKTRRGLGFNHDREERRERDAYERGHLAGREQQRAKMDGAQEVMPTEPLVADIVTAVADDREADCQSRDPRGGWQCALSDGHQGPHVGPCGHARWGEGRWMPETINARRAQEGK